MKFFFKVKNLQKLKRAGWNRGTFEILDCCDPHYIGQIRDISYSNEVGFFAINPNNPSSVTYLENRGKGLWIGYGKAKEWKFEEGNLCTKYFFNENDEKELLISFRFIN